MMHATSRAVPRSERAPRAVAWRCRTYPDMARNLLEVLDMPVPFPHHYQTWLVRTLSSRARLEAPPRPLISGGPPPELDGDASAWSAEHLLLSSIGMCVLTTFEALAARERVDLVTWEARVGGMVDRTETGLHFTKFTIAVYLSVRAVERARATLDEAQQHCLVSNALRAHVEIIAKIRPWVRKAS